MSKKEKEYYCQDCKYATVFDGKSFIRANLYCRLTDELDVCNMVKREVIRSRCEKVRNTEECVYKRKWWKFWRTK